MNDRQMTPEMRGWIDQCQGMVRSIATKIFSRLPASVNYDDLVSYGQVGLVQAAYSFDPSKEVAFQTFAYYRIRGAIYDGLGKMSWTSRAVQQRIRAEQMSAYMLEQQVELNRVSAERQASLVADAEWIVKTTENLTVVQLLADGVGGGLDGTEQIVDPEMTPDEEVSQRELCELLTSLVNDLPEIERDLIQLTYFQGMTITEAAENLNRSKSWGSRTHARILERLGRSLSINVVS